MHHVSGPDDDDSPSGPFGEDFTNMLASMGNAFGGMLPIGLTGARQIAASIALGGVTESNVDPLLRGTFEQLSRVAELHVAEMLGRPVDDGGHDVVVVPHNRLGWIDVSLRELAPLFAALSGSLGATIRAQLADLGEMGDDLDPEVAQALGAAGFGPNPAALFAQLGATLGPVMSQMLSGSTLGHLATRSFGSYDLPLPRQLDRVGQLAVILPNVDAFASDWELDVDDVHMWVCISEIAHHAVIAAPNAAAALRNLLMAHAEGFGGENADPEQLAERLDAELDDGSTDPAERIQELFTDPTQLLGALRTDDQRRIVDELHRLVTVLEGLAEYLTDEISQRVLARPGPLGEALRRRRVTTDEATHFVEQLFGLQLDWDQLERGRHFARGVVDRAGVAALQRAWENRDELPTLTELDAPGLWLTRIGVDFEADDSDIVDVEIPDFLDLPDDE